MSVQVHGAYTILIMCLYVYFSNIIQIFCLKTNKNDTNKIKKHKTIERNWTNKANQKNSNKTLKMINKQTNNKTWHKKQTKHDKNNKNI